MLAYVRPVGRDYCFTPSCFEKAAGRASAPPKSPARVTFAPRCASTGRAKEGRQVRRDDSQEIIPMYTPKTETPRPGRALGDWHSRRDDTAEYAKPASILFAEANQVIATFPAIMTIKRKREAESKVLDLWLQALAASREVVV